MIIEVPPHGIGLMFTWTEFDLTYVHEPNTPCPELYTRMRVCERCLRDQNSNLIYKVNK
jgi:hypothetical protein